LSLKISKFEKKLKPIKLFKNKIYFNLKTSPSSILNKERREINYIKGIIRKEFKLNLNLIKILKKRIKEIESNLMMS